ncbi:MAG: metalloregulator ArsR/SmtB family transcription factor [Ornithinimicrobium sp.]
MIDAWQAAAEPSRRHLLHLLSGGELSAGDLAEHFSSTRSATSQHLAVLRAAGLVDVRSEGRQRLYQLNPDGMRRLRTEITSFWTDELDALTTEATAMTHRGDPLVDTQHADSNGHAS